MLGRPRTPRRRLAAVVVLALVGITACGARLTAEQKQLALRGTGTSAGSTGVTTTGGATTGTATGTTTGGSTGTTSTGGTTTGTTGATTGTTGGTATGTTGAGGTTAGSTGPAGGETCTATAKNNGGSTDKGITATQITISNISDISGPVPGLFKSAEQAAQAYVNYFNSSHPDGICGRMLKLVPRDSATDSGTDRTQTQNACSDSFAIVGSQSAFDDGGAPPAKSCGIVDIPAAAVTSARQDNPTTHAANSTSMHYLSDSVPKYFESSKFGSAAKHAAFLYIDAGASAQNAQQDIKAFHKAGFTWAYTAGLPVQNATTQGFAPYVQKMKDKGVQFVEWLGAYQEAASLAQAMQNGSFKPKAYLLDPTGYTPQYLSQAGSAAEGTYIYDNAAPLSDSSSNAELQIYTQSLQASGVSDPPTYFGQFAWSAMRLFTDLAFKIGPKLTRAKMNAELKNVSNWTDRGMHAPQSVGSKVTGKCFNVLQVQGGQFAQAYPARRGTYSCGNLIHV